MGCTSSSLKGSDVQREDLGAQGGPAPELSCQNHRETAKVLHMCLFRRR
jgi:hypothetical protein